MRSCTLLFCAAAFAAFPPPVDFWTAKNYMQWTEKEAQRMLSDSPWARPVDVRGAAPEPPALATGRRPDRNAPALDLDAAGPAFRAVLRCQSALPVRQALARIRYGAAGLDSPEAQDLVSRTETHYVFVLDGLPEQLVSTPRAQLKVKGHAPVKAEKTDAVRESGRAVVYALFPRAGNPITIEDGEFEIAFRLDGADIRRTFKLKDLRYDGRPEL